MSNYKKELLEVVKFDVKLLNLDKISLNSIESIADILGIDIEEIREEVENEQL